MISKVVSLDSIEEVFQKLLDPGNHMVQVVVQCSLPGSFSVLS